MVIYCTTTRAPWRLLACATGPIEREAGPVRARISSAGNLEQKIYALWICSDKNLPWFAFFFFLVVLLLLFLFLFFVFVFVRGSSAGEERGGRKEREMLNEKWSLLSHGWSLIRTVFDGMSRCNVLSIAGW